MATSAAQLATILTHIAQKHDLDEKKLLTLLDADGLLPAKLKPKEAKSKTVSLFASKAAEEFASVSGFAAEGREGSGRDGKFTLADIKKIVESPKKEKLNVSPTALVYANENGIDLSKITGSGKEGRILLDDVKTKAEKKDKLNISPKALEMAKDVKMKEKEIAKVKGTGKDGKILQSDMKDYIDKNFESQSEGENSDSD